MISSHPLPVLVPDGRQARDLSGYLRYPHGMATTHADVINADMLAFIRG